MSVGDLAKPHSGPILQVDLAEANAALIEHLARHPQLIYESDPRRFEEVIAEIFAGLGYDVVLTPPSKDGGRDLKAYRKDACGTLLTLVECKRYGREHRVGVGIVRQLYGVVEKERASHGIVATTSFFTKGARAEHEQLRFRLSLSDFDQVVTWCRQFRPSH